MPQLTEAKIRNIKASGKIERFHDSRGLYLELSVAGGMQAAFVDIGQGRNAFLSVPGRT